MKAKPFDQIAMSFAGNVHAIRALNERIGGHADEHDRTARNAFVKKTLDALGFREWVRSAVSRGERKEELLERIENSDEIESFVRDALAQPATLQRMDRVHREYRRLPPVQGDLLRRGALTTLLAFFESLLTELIQAYYGLNPVALPQEAHTLSLAELKNLGSVEEAERYILEKESESVLRNSLDDQLKYFASRLKLDLSSLDAIKLSLGEIVQRRNVIVHNNGVVNRVYLSKVPADLLQRYMVSEGSKLAVSQEYLAEAASIVWRAGTIVLQQGWRKWDAGSVGAADAYLVEHSYDLLVAGIDSDVTALAEYVRTVKTCSDRANRVILINAATALRRMGRGDEIADLIGTCDWTACSIDFQLALAAIRNDVHAACDLLPRAVASGSILEADVREWPLFEVLRLDQEFMNVAARLFPDGPATSVAGTTPED